MARVWGASVSYQLQLRDRGEALGNSWKYCARAKFAVLTSKRLSPAKGPKVLGRQVFQGCCRGLLGMQVNLGQQINTHLESI